MYRKSRSGVRTGDRVVLKEVCHVSSIVSCRVLPHGFGRFCSRRELCRSLNHLSLLDWTPCDSSLCSLRETTLICRKRASSVGETDRLLPSPRTDKVGDEGLSDISRLYPDDNLLVRPDYGASYGGSADPRRWVLALSLLDELHHPYGFRSKTAPGRQSLTHPRHWLGLQKVERRSVFPT